MINSKMIFRILGFLLLIETAMLLCCGAVSLFYKENDLQSFLISSAVTACIGFLLLAIGKDAVKSLNRRDGYVIVSAAWVTFSLFGMLPYYIGGYIPNVADAFFETMSGFSSTGATILNNIESMPHGILFWRAMTQWIGGLGIVFFTIAVLPIFGVGGIQVFAAESYSATRMKTVLNACFWLILLVLILFFTMYSKTKIHKILSITSGIILGMQIVGFLSLFPTAAKKSL